MNVFAHHLYEYSKGVRRLVLFTSNSKYWEVIKYKLKLEKLNVNILLHNNNKARYQPRSAMRVVHRERKKIKIITCLKNIHSDAINKNTNK